MNVTPLGFRTSLPIRFNLDYTVGSLGNPRSPILIIARILAREIFKIIKTSHLVDALYPKFIKKLPEVLDPSNKFSNLIDCRPENLKISSHANYSH